MRGLNHLAKWTDKWTNYKNLKNTELEEELKTNPVVHLNVFSR